MQFWELSKSLLPITCNHELYSRSCDFLFKLCSTRGIMLHWRYYAHIIYAGIKWHRFPLLATLYILVRVAGKVCIHLHLSQFSETTALCCKNISIMPALCLMLQIPYNSQNYAGVIWQTLLVCSPRWPDVVAGISACQFQNLLLFCFVLFCYITNHNLNIEIQSGNKAS